MSADAPDLVANVLAAAIGLQKRFPAGSRIHMEAQNIETACRNILRVLPFEMAKPGQPSVPAPRLRIVTPEG